MKQLLTILSTCIFISAVCGQSKPIDITPGKAYTISQVDLHGNVKSITETRFNKKMSGYDEGGTLTRKFDQSGKITETKNVLMFSGMSMGTITEKYTYDAKGKLAKIILSGGNGPDETETFLYDAKGNMSGKDYATSDGVTKEKYEYDGQGKLIVKKIFRSGAKTPYSISRYTYDAMNRLTVAEYENTESKKTSRTRYTYTDKNMQPKSSLYEGELDIEMNTNAARGSEFEYNAAGDITMQVPVNASGRINLEAISYKYEYDNNSNWTRATATGYGAGYTVRKIEYYPAPEKPEEAYANAILELSEPVLKSFSALVESAMNKSSAPAVLVADKNKIVALAKDNIEKLKKVPDLAGNNTKQLIIQMLQFTIAAPTLKKVDSIIMQSADMNTSYQDLGTELMNLRKQVMAEFAKLK